MIDVFISNAETLAAAVTSVFAQPQLWAIVPLEQKIIHHACSVDHCESDFIEYICEGIFCGSQNAAYR